MKDEGLRKFYDLYMQFKHGSDQERVEAVERFKTEFDTDILKIIEMLKEDDKI